VVDAPAAVTDRVRTSRVESATGIELRIAVQPDPRGAGLAAQARSMYTTLIAALAAQGAGPGAIVAEKVFLSDVAHQADWLWSVRRATLRSGVDGNGGGSRWSAPDGAPDHALTLIQQPPVDRHMLCEAQVVAILPAAAAAPPSWGLTGLPPGASGSEVRLGGRRMLQISGLTGGGAGAAPDFETQARAMFETAETCLRDRGLEFRDVVRTWIYVGHIDRDYAAINRARREFYRARGIDPPPPSTGIGGLSDRPGCLCALDLIARDGDARGAWRILHAPTMNEAPSYGADFSRGAILPLAIGSTLFVSGTASIDALGRVVHVNDIAGQAERMLDNVAQVLAGEGLGLQDVTSAVTYLKRPRYREAFLEAARRAGLPASIPNTLCLAAVCRPEWLCEIEATVTLT
jgi:enamine deaminase RidA (YjgF/YER057c/UK114 family)